MVIKKILLSTARVLLATVLIVWLWQKGFLDLGQLQQSLKISYFILGLFVCASSIVVNNWRWWILVRAVEEDHSFFYLLKLTFLGLFFNHAIPGGVGGDVIKGYYLVKEKRERRANALMSIIMDRLVGFWAMSFMALGSVVLRWDLIESSYSLRLITMGVLGVFLLFTGLFIIARLVSTESLRERFELFLNRFSLLDKFIGVFLKAYQVLNVYMKQPAVIFKTFILSLLSQGLAVVFMIMAGRMMGFLDLDVMAYFFTVPLVFIVSAVPIAPAGIGVGQAASLYLFNLVIGEESTLGPNVISSYQIMLFLMSLVGAYFYAMGGMNKKLEDVDTGDVLDVR